MKFNRILRIIKKYGIFLLILLILFICLYFYLNKKSENFQSEYYTQDTCHESRIECNNPAYPDKDLADVNGMLAWVCYKKCSLMPDNNNNYSYSDSDKEESMCIIRNKSDDEYERYAISYVSRSYIPAECNSRPQCKRVSCPTGTLWTYGGQNFLGDKNETTVETTFTENDTIINNTCVLPCQQRNGFRLDENDTNCMYADNNNDIDMVSKEFSKPRCDDSMQMLFKGVKFSTTSCSYTNERRTLNDFKANLKCPKDFKLETYTKNNILFPRCTKKINKVNNKCPSGTYQVSNSNNKCNIFKNPICIDGRNQYDKSNGFCLKGSCKNKILFNKKCYKCKKDYIFNETTKKCDKKNAASISPNISTPSCYSK